MPTLSKVDPIAFSQRVDKMKSLDVGENDSRTKSTATDTHNGSLVVRDFGRRSTKGVSLKLDKRKPTRQASKASEKLRH
jgi:hypothetical protein